MSLRGNNLGTEYRRSYKKSQYNCSATTYQQNLDFRREQKRRFVEHNPDPFDWNPEDIESDSESELSCRDLNRSTNLTHTQYKHEKLNQLYDKRLTDRQEPSHSGVQMKKVHSSSQSKDFQSSNRSHQVVDRKEEMASDDSGSESETSVVHVIEPEFVKEKSSTKLSLPFADKQTQTERKSSKQEVKYSKQEEKYSKQEDKYSKQEDKHSNHGIKHLPPGPFLPYGYEADAVETGKKLTHNIRAAQQIYPSALRAQKLRNAKAEDTHSQAKSGQGLSGRNSQASDCLQKTRSEPFRIFVHNECSDDDDNLNWVTEYDRNYQLYPEKEYRKNAANSRAHSREFIPRAVSNSQKSTRK